MRDKEELLTKINDSIVKDINNKKDFLTKLDKYNTLSLSEKIELIKELGFSHIVFNRTELILDLIKNDFNSKELTEKNVNKGFSNNIIFTIDDFVVKIPLWISNTIVIKDMKSKKEPIHYSNFKIKHEKLFLSYIKYKENNTRDNLNKFLEVEFPHIKNKHIRYINHLCEKTKESDLDYEKEYKRRKEQLKINYEKKLKDYKKREEEKSCFVKSIQADLDYFSNNGWDIKYIDF